MHLLLVAGFLGSGKTTFIIKLAQAVTQAGHRVAIVVNEIGEIGIDDQLMRRLALNVWELLSGCICCTLSGDLVTTLQTLQADYAPDLVLVEPSGVAEPGNVLTALPYYQGDPLASVHCVVLLDPLRLPMLFEVLTPLVTAQMRHADWLIINKTDVASTEDVAAAHRIANEANPNVEVLCASAKEGLEPGLLSELLPWLN